MARSRKNAPGARAAGQEQAVAGTATLRHVRISAQKARLAVNLIKGRSVDSALQVLRFANKKSCKLVAGVLESAIANAREQKGADVDRLQVVGGWVDQGRSLRRFMPRARGMATPILKRSSHITIQVGER